MEGSFGRGGHLGNARLPALCRPTVVLDRSAARRGGLDRSTAYFAHGCVIRTVARGEAVGRAVSQGTLHDTLVSRRTAVRGDAAVRIAACHALHRVPSRGRGPRL